MNKNIFKMEKMNFLLILVFILLNPNISCDALSYVCDKNSVPCGCGQKNVEINVQAAYDENSVPYSWPMIVSLRRYDTRLRYVCTGTILSESYILIAANCIHGYATDEAFKNLTIAAGVYNLSQTNGIIRKIDKIIIHPLWEKLGSEYIYDIAILHLSEPLDLTANSSLARTCLPPQQNISEDNMKYPSNGTRLFNVGWHVSDRSGEAILSLQQMTFHSIHHLDKICSKTIRNPAVQFCAGFFKCDKGKKIIVEIF
jgi:secreted trypsin-like serine protease